MGDFLHAKYALMSGALEDREPTHVGEAIKQDLWRKAMEVEIDCIERNGTWELIPRLVSWKIIGVKWVYKVEYYSDGSLDKHKARFVAKGNAQCCGVEYDATFACIAGMVGKKKWQVYQMDVKSPFLSGD